MFEESKKLYDRAVAHDAALSQIENQRSGTSKSHKIRNTILVVSAIAVFILVLALR